jgi:hypothetical protein
MTRQVTLSTPARVADFAAGDGGLLVPAALKWRSSQIVACDFNSTAVGNLRRRFPTWWISRCDFLSDRSVESTRHLPALWGSVDVVLLNPPFSQRGGQTWKIVSDRRELTCGVALAFLFRALRFLSSEGQLVSVLPASCLHSERDAAAMAELRRRYLVQEVCRLARGRFEHCAASSVVLSLRPVSEAQPVRAGESPAAGTWQVERGSAQMHAIIEAKGRRGCRLIHTDNLKDGCVTGPFRRVHWHRSVSGAFVLLPRVGRLTPAKVVADAFTRPIVLSDCVIAVRCADLDEATRVRKVMCEDWALLQEIFGGTGAPYTTIRKVRCLLADIYERVGHEPVCPKPPLPRCVSLNVSCSRHETRDTGAMTNCAKRMPRVMATGEDPKFRSATLTSPR